MTNVPREGDGMSVYSKETLSHSLCGKLEVTLLNGAHVPGQGQQLPSFLSLNSE